MKRIINILAVLAAIGCGNAVAAFIDFETVPGSAPADQLAITDQYLISDGVRFYAKKGGDTEMPAYLEASGMADRGHGFLNDRLPGFVYDQPRAGYEAQLGSFFLRVGTNELETSPISLFMEFSNPVSMVSAELWDIDSHSGKTEQWRIAAFDINGTEIDFVTSPVGLFDEDDPASLDAIPWDWTIDRGGVFDIYSVEIEFIGTKTDNIGLALNNVSFSAVPLPPAVWLFGSALIGFFGLSKRKTS